ncbi:hypothetical protein HK100_008044, partial [Physocladia obscura]
MQRGAESLENILGVKSISSLLDSNTLLYNGFTLSRTRLPNTVEQLLTLEALLALYIPIKDQSILERLKLGSASPQPVELTRVADHEVTNPKMLTASRLNNELCGFTV